MAISVRPFALRAHAFILLLAAVLSVVSAGVEVYVLPPVLTLQEAGRLHGLRAKDRIASFFQTWEIRSLLRFTRSSRGKEALDALRSASSSFLPSLAEELVGLAEGAGVAVEHLWAVTLIAELQALEGVIIPHCTDAMAREASGAVWHGHNEDWSSEFRPLVYFVVYRALPNATFRPIGGLVYPGQPPGFAVTFTPTIWTTSNSLFPVGVNASGVGIVAAARSALLAHSAEDVARRYGQRGQAYGMNTQIVANTPGRAFAAFVEVAGKADASHLERLSHNLTHFNRYKHLNVSQHFLEPSIQSSAMQQTAADRHLAPTTRADVLRIIGDTTDFYNDYPIYRTDITMCSMLFHSQSGKFWVWHGRNPSSAEPDWSSSLKGIFAPDAEEQARSSRTVPFVAGDLCIWLFCFFSLNLL